MNARYSPGQIRSFFDDYGEREWERFQADPAAVVSLHLHTRYLQRYIQAGNTVLDAGAGPGRFTIELAKLGAIISVGDISPRQLEINSQKVQNAGFEHAVVKREVLDITDLSEYPSQMFDAVIAYGGPLSYVFDRADDAIDELLRVIKPRGHLLLSVMSLLGSTRKLLPGILSDVGQYGLEKVQQLLGTGDHHGALALGHNCHLYRWTELKEVLSRHPCRIVAASAANFLSVGNGDVLEQVKEDAKVWAAFLHWEEEFCAVPAALDGGTHIIVVAQRT
jgi:SAM-dependent methyltransferase